MNKPVQGGKIVEALFFDNALQVEFDVRLASYEGAVAQQAKRGAVRHDTPEVFGTVEIFLHERMRRQAWSSRCGHTT